MKTKEIAKKNYDWMVKLRRELHMYPEESFKEFKTSKKIIEELKKIGIEVQKLGDTGVIGLIHGKKEGKVIGLRADIDALSVTEKTGLEYSSKVPKMMHACGHDCHVAMLLGAAKILSEMKDEINGTVKFIFQPAEEVGSGAKKMIEWGALENPKLDMIFGMHIWAYEQIGEVVLQKGPLMASADMWKLNIKGKSCHGSEPWKGVDAITCASAVVQGLHSLVARVNDARDPIVINIGTLNGGERFNVVPGSATLTGMNRAFTRNSREKMESRMEKIIKNICEAYGCEYDFEYNYMCSPTINEEESADLCIKSVGNIIGEENVIKTKKIMGSEDFSEYLNYVPGALMLLGAANKEKNCCHSHHSNYFNVDEEALKTGAASYAQVAIDFLNK